MRDSDRRLVIGGLPADAARVEGAAARAKPRANLEEVLMASSTPTVVGSVVSLWRYPVKSMMGEELNASELTQRGLLGDRTYALVDAVDGKVASAKNPRKWSKLFDFRAVFVEEPRPRAK